MEKFTRCWLIDQGYTTDIAIRLRYFWTFGPIFTFSIAALMLIVTLLMLKKHKLFLVQVGHIFFIVVYLS